MDPKRAGWEPKELEITDVTLTQDVELPFDDTQPHPPDWDEPLSEEQDQDAF